MRQERSRLFLSLGEAGNWHGPQVNPTPSAIFVREAPRASPGFADRAAIGQADAPV
jgi:hypothetical protein